MDVSELLRLTLSESTSGFNSHSCSELGSEPISKRTQLQLFLLGKKIKKNSRVSVKPYNLNSMSHTV